jgi:lipoprotein-releasing system ATP-binding protein
MNALELRNLWKSYDSPAGRLEVLRNICLILNAPAAVAVMGPSGSGKSTLLHILGVLDRPSRGEVWLDGVNPFLLEEREQAQFRNRKIGFVFQDHALLPQCSVLENVLVPTLVSPTGDNWEERARYLLRRVGLEQRLDHLPAALSGGEKQRTAIARALIASPRLVLCDEPTGNLDRVSAKMVADLLLELHREQGNILIVVTHSSELAARFDARFELKDGQLHPA